MMESNEVLTSSEAAAFLKKHVVTVNQMARDRIIPAGKVGSEWRFMKADLIAHLRAQYQPRPDLSCLSTSRKAAPTGLPASKSPASHAYVDRLEQRIAAKRSASTMNGKRSYGR